MYIIFPVLATLPENFVSSKNFQNFFLACTKFSGHAMCSCYHIFFNIFFLSFFQSTSIAISGEHETDGGKYEVELREININIIHMYTLVACVSCVFFFPVGIPAILYALQVSLCIVYSNWSLQWTHKAKNTTRVRLLFLYSQLPYSLCTPCVLIVCSLCTRMKQTTR